MTILNFKVTTLLAVLLMIFMYMKNIICSIMIRRGKTGGSGRVRVGFGQSDLWVNRVASQNGSFLNELIKLQVN